MSIFPMSPHLEAIPLGFFSQSLRHLDQPQKAPNANIAFQRLHALLAHGYYIGRGQTDWEAGRQIHVLELYHHSNPDGPHYNRNGELTALLIFPDGQVMPTEWRDMLPIEAYDQSGFADFVAALPPLRHRLHWRAAIKALFGVTYRPSNRAVDR